MSRMYTVVGFDEGQLTEGHDGAFVESVRAMSPNHAAHVTRRVRAEQTGDDPETVEIICVFPGEQLDYYDGSTDRAELDSMDAELAAETEDDLEVWED